MARVSSNEGEHIAVDLLKDVVLREVSPDVRRFASSAARLEATMRRMDVVADEYRNALEKTACVLIQGSTSAVSSTDIVNSCRSIFDELFADGSYTWGRVTVAYVYVAILTKRCVVCGHLQLHELDSFVEQIGQLIVPGAIESIRAVGGWDKLERHFQQQESRDLATTRWHGLLKQTFVELGAAFLMLA